jgi:hypothetical protein
MERTHAMGRRPKRMDVQTVGCSVDEGFAGVARARLEAGL